MRQLPTGTVTFFFSDIEGSTRLLHELGGDGYSEALARHQALLREAFRRNEGVEVGTQGDSFFVVFERASDAVSAAEEARRALESGPIRVRIGIHTGRPLLTEAGYVGLDVHRAARIAAAGHGGQILISEASHELLDSAFELRDLGEHRLKDLTAPERIYQLGSDEFRPLKSLNQTNLPAQPTALVGREAELEEVLELVRSHSLVTLSGPGGSGKTRLALQAAAELVQELQDGVWFVSLAALRDEGAVLATIAQTLGVPEHETLEQHLAHRQGLLLLDNFEQLLGAAAEIGNLLRQAPTMKILVTSRARLHLAGEREYAVPPLSDEDAVALFVERVRAAKPTFEPDEHVGDICRRLDNLPLAVELAAARTKVLVPPQLLERLEQRLPLLIGGLRDAPERQRTLRATIDWSYELLSEEEKQLFRRLAVFAGSFDLAAAEEVCDADLDTMSSLVDKSLLRQTEDGRFFILATIREYASERLDEDPEAELLRRRHADRTLRIAEEAEPRRREGFADLQAEHDNARAALDFLVKAGAAEPALRLALAYRDYWFVRDIREGRRRLEAVLAMSEDTPAELRLRALIRAASLARVVGDSEAGEKHASGAVALARELGDEPGLADALRELGQVMSLRGEFTAAFSLYEEALAVARAAGDSLVPTLTDLADVALAAGELERAIDYAAQASELARGHDAEIVQAIAAYNTAAALVQLGRDAEAPPYIRSALDTFVSIDYSELIGWGLAATSAFVAASEAPEAARLLGAAEAAVESAGAALGPAEQRLRDWTLSLLRERLGDAELQEFLQRGSELDPTEAVSLARRHLAS
jgi:predicted ATPase